MKKRLLGFLICAMFVSVCVGCGAESTTTEQIETTATTATEDATPEQTTEPTATPEATEEPHTHNYTEEITTDATCEADGLKTFTCECGDTYTEAIVASGHNYENYVYNDDATYLADGTETATCICGLTDTRTKEGSKLEYTYTDMTATMYATQTVNVRNLPSTDGEKIGSLSTNQEIAVLGQCNETSWYKFELDGQTAFVSNSYLSTEKVESQQTQSTNNAGGGECPYPIYQIIDEGGDNVYFYRAWDDSKGPNWANADYNADQWNVLYKQCAQTIASRHGWDFGSVDYMGPTERTPYYIEGYQVLKQKVCVIGPDGTITNWN